MPKLCTLWAESTQGKRLHAYYRRGTRAPATARVLRGEAGWPASAPQNGFSDREEKTKAMATLPGTGRPSRDAA